MVEGKRELPSQEKGRKRRYLPGLVALHEIRKFQKIYLVTNQEVTVCEVGEGNCSTHKGQPQIPGNGPSCPQEAAEAYVINLFDDVNLCAIHGKPITMMPKYIQLA